MNDHPPSPNPEMDAAAGSVLQEEVNRRRAADGLALRGQLPRGVRPLDRDAFTTHVASGAYRPAASTRRRATRKWRPVVIAGCIGVLATLAGTAVWGFFPDEVTESLSGLDRAVVSLGTR